MVQHLPNTYSIFSQPRRGYICSEVHMHVYTLDHVMMEQYSISRTVVSCSFIAYSFHEVTNTSQFTLCYFIVWHCSPKTQLQRPVPERGGSSEGELDLLPPDHYLVQYRKVGKLPQNPWHTVNITGSPPPTTAYLEGLSANAPHGYWVRVIAVSTVGQARRWPMQQFRISGSEFDVLCKYNSACVI